MKPTIELQAELLKYGVQEDHLKEITQDVTPELLAYADLIRNQELKRHVSAVVEDEGRPLLYVVSAQTLPQNGDQRSTALQRLAGLLACRGTVAYLCLVDFGVMTVYPCGLVDRPLTDTDAFLVVHATEPHASTTFQTLLQGHAQTIPDRNDQKRFSPLQVSDLLKDILLTVCDRMMATGAYGEGDAAADQVLALVGRAVFVRFLADRQIINPNTFPELYQRFGGAENAFRNPEAAALTCMWLDDTFNGELLPLPVEDQAYFAYFLQLDLRSQGALLPLGQILHKETTFGLTPLWPMVDFAHVPAGLLSEVYEQFVGAYNLEKKHRDSVYYTPLHIADPLITQAFRGIPHPLRHQVKVLDPAAGAGVFLVLALQRLVEHQWKATGERPTAKVIREIMYRQIRGMDINRHALILAALSLYLTVIELAPNSGTSELPFERNLLGSVLFDVGGRPEGHLGSMRSDLPSEFLHGFDVVVGNPPWTGKSGRNVEVQKFKAASNRVAQEVIESRLLKEDTTARKYKIPDTYPDVAFLWRTMQLAKPGAVIALLLHGRLISGVNTATTRIWLSRTLRIHGILNASDFADETRFWKIEQPFIMLFARNVTPKPSDRFWFVSPYIDDALVQRRRLRIDPRQAHTFTHDDLASKPELLRILFRGTTLDLAIIESIKALIGQQSQIDTAASYPLVLLGDLCSEQVEGGKIVSRVGYKVGSKSTSVDHLLSLHGKDLTPRYSNAHPHLMSVLPALLDDFGYSHLHRINSADAYLPPLVLAFERQSAYRNAPKALLALHETPIIYNGSFVGFSTRNTADPDGWAMLLFLVLNSSLVTYYLLMTSPHFGVTRRRVNAIDIRAFPVPDWNTLPDSMKNRVRELGLWVYGEGNTTENFSRIDALVFELYGLSEWDGQVIRDTLDTQLPHTEVRRHSQAIPSLEQQKAFMRQLQATIDPVFDVLGRKFIFSEVKRQGEAWCRFTVRDESLNPEVLNTHLHALDMPMKHLADESGASYVHYVLEPGKFVAVDILAQNRYWTITRAHLLAGEIMKWLA